MPFNVADPNNIVPASLDLVADRDGDFQESRVYIPQRVDFDAPDEGMPFVTLWHSLQRIQELVPNPAQNEVETRVHQNEVGNEVEAQGVDEAAHTTEQEQHNSGLYLRRLFNRLRPDLRDVHERNRRDMWLVKYLAHPTALVPPSRMQVRALVHAVDAFGDGGPGGKIMNHVDSEHPLSDFHFVLDLLNDLVPDLEAVDFSSRLPALRHSSYQQHQGQAAQASSPGAAPYLWNVLYEFAAPELQADSVIIAAMLRGRPELRLFDPVLQKQIDAEPQRYFQPLDELLDLRRDDKTPCSAPYLILGSTTTSARTRSTSTSSSTTSASTLRERFQTDVGFVLEMILRGAKEMAWTLTSQAIRENEDVQTALLNELAIKFRTVGGPAVNGRRLIRTETGVEKETVVLKPRRDDTRTPEMEADEEREWKEEIWQELSHNYPEKLLWDNEYFREHVFPSMSRKHLTLRDGTPENDWRLLGIYRQISRDGWVDRLTSHYILELGPWRLGHPEALYCTELRKGQSRAFVQMFQILGFGELSFTRCP
ncbi:unnamed protein product [Amoebophrya sp. A25]|nr:unnamed protein product [Amoebophrya sp. A25]|eukprot:GSA25T00003379001.1